MRTIRRRPDRRDREIREVLSSLKIRELLPIWEYVDSLERAGLIRPLTAGRWKDAVVRLIRARSARPMDPDEPRAPRPTIPARRLGWIRGRDHEATLHPRRRG